MPAPHRTVQGERVNEGRAEREDSQSTGILRKARTVVLLDRGGELG